MLGSYIVQNARQVQKWIDFQDFEVSRFKNYLLMGDCHQALWEGDQAAKVLKDESVLWGCIMACGLGTGNWGVLARGRGFSLV